MSFILNTFSNTFFTPFFWAFISMFALMVATAGISGIKAGTNMVFGFLVSFFFMAGQVMMVLPMCVQPRFSIGIWHDVIGGVVLATAAVFTSPAFTINPLSAPKKQMKLRTTGFYGICRNPLYVANLLIPLGFSILYGSIIGLSLMPFWWISLIFLTLVEEKTLEKTLGQEYLDYKQKVKGRIIPGLPI